MNRIRLLGTSIAIAGVALLSGCADYGPGYGYGYGGPVYSQPYYVDPGPVYVAPPSVYIQGGSYYGRPYYDRPGYYGRPGYPGYQGRPPQGVRPPHAGSGRPPVAAVPSMPGVTPSYRPGASAPARSVYEALHPAPAESQPLPDRP
ncbi:MAG: hypothetical protein EOP82_04345 [Variovorax sp.]|nr:MAG: hypothetical protein EOP82_04345 [Variovorax sp.]